MDVEKWARINRKITAGELIRELRKPCKVYVQTRYTEDDTICVLAVKADVIWNLQQCRPDMVVRAYEDDDGNWVIN